ncbi:hypothetical protein [Niallia sp. Krafla_26]|uniref:hypothetical protein n=1 Tax=Niallia sp. Krafla_26 TaxID=3064703 RepID=UPI003D16C466
MNTLNTLFNMMGRNKRNMFGKRRNNKTIMWTTLIGLGASAAAYGMRRNRNVDISRTVQNAMNTMRNGNMNHAMAEFAQELMPKQNRK